MADELHHSLRPGSSGSTAVEGRLWPDVLLSRWFLLLAVTGLAATALLLFTGRDTAARRLPNLELSAAGIPDSYLMLSKGPAERGYLVDRRDSTIRRSRANYPGKRWNVERFAGSSTGPEHWLLRSKRFGTVFFVPVEEVPDLDYPFFYGFVRGQLEDHELPSVGWTQLFVNRVYSGLYLRVDLPVDPRKKDGRSGLLRELLMVRGDRMTLVDTRFNSDGRLYAECVSNGVFPELREPPPALSWLARRAGTAETTFLLNSAEPFDVTLLPLPVSLAGLFEKLHRAPLEPTVDQRLGEWMAPVAAGSIAAEAPFDEDLRRRMEEDLAEYRSSLGAALRAHLALHDSTVSSRISALLHDATDEPTLPR